MFRAPLIRSTMLLDFFATFFSSATALLPIYAQDILRRRRARLRLAVRGTGGWARSSRASSWSAPSTGSSAGDGSCVGVVGYGLATIASACREFWLTFVCLAVTGASDTVSTIFRNLIRQLETPDQLRGRMTGVNMVFFMGGPQLGELEAGPGRATGSGRSCRS